jgi:gamma-glutamylcyclotransferase (GGCT)/AIG2-like uncharacterized protein YtfP
MTEAQHMYLFVYGSLRPAWRRTSSIGGAAVAKQALRQKARHLGQARVQGELFDLGRYPGLLLHKDDCWVMGDLFQIRDNSLLRTLDRYEGCDELSPRPHEYQRVETHIEFDGQMFSQPVWIYESLFLPPGARKVNSGDWLKLRVQE